MRTRCNYSRGVALAMSLLCVCKHVNTEILNILAANISGFTEFKGDCYTVQPLTGTTIQGYKVKSP